jgi:hypothetical protein
MSSEASHMRAETLHATQVHDAMLAHVFDS